MECTSLMRLLVGMAPLLGARAPTPVKLCRVQPISRNCNRIAAQNCRITSSVGRAAVPGRARYSKIAHNSPTNSISTKSRFIQSSFTGSSLCVCITARRRGNRLIVAATLADAAQSDFHEAAEALLGIELEGHPKLDIGHLPNGLRYVILPNATPPARFEAHLEVHAGSVDERETEQGIAHLVEHVTFLGSKKRENLLGTGARSNAYTDFHHTVFHMHAPHQNANTGEPMLPAVLDALAEIAFEPEFLVTRIEKERKAVVAEAQMMNTIEYRVDCQLLQYLHWENALGSRFPIGKTEQVEKWQRDEITHFWSRHYFPANATLYVVGDIDPQETKELVESVFGRVPPSLEIPNPGAASLDAALLAENDAASDNDDDDDDVSSSSNGSSSKPTGALLDAEPWSRPLIRPPVEHQWGCGPMLGAGKTASVSIFKHRLLQLFQLSVFCKLPVQPMKTLKDLRRAFMVRIMLSVLQFRINARYVAADPPFISIELDHSDSGREGCAVSTLTITSEPRDWRGAVQVAVQEVRRLQKFGVTSAELERYKSALLRDSEQLAEGAASVPSVDNLDFVMESMALGHTVLDQKAAHDYLLALSETVTADEVNTLARSLLSFASHYKNEATLEREYEADPSAWATPGPSVATSIVACVPAFMDASGTSMGGAAPMQRGASMATTQHVDPALAATAVDSLDDSSAEEPPEGAIRFELDAAAIEEALAEAGMEVEPLPDVDVPDALLSDEQIETLVATCQPQFVPIDGTENGPVTPPVDAATGIVQRKLSNGIRVNYRHTDNEPRAAMVRVVASGGRSREGSGAGPAGNGAVAVGTRTLSESGTVGDWDREQVELFCISRLINCVLEADEEFLCMDFHFAVGDGGMASVLQLLHLFLQAPRWEHAAMERSKQMYLSHYRSLSKSFERASADRIMASMMGDDRRFRDPNPAEIEALTLEGMREAVMAQLHPANIEVSVVGDFDAAELEDGVLKYLGTVAPRKDVPEVVDRPFRVSNPSADDRHIAWHLLDSDERACAYIAGPAPNRWGNFTGEQQRARAAGEVIAPMQLPINPTPEQVRQAATIRRGHPLYASVTLGLLTEIVNSRLFTTVRDTLGLTYDVSFELSLFDRLPSGWYHVNVTSTPAKITDAMMASLKVLRSIKTSPITQRELLRAKRTLITRHESDMKDNIYWLGLLTHLQSDSVPLKSVDCLRDLRGMWEAATVEDIYDAVDQFNFDDDNVFTCIGTSGKEPVLAKSPVLEAAAASSIAAANGLGQNNRASAGKGDASQQQVDPEAFMNAFRSFLGQQQPPSGGN